ncbi:MAG: hypothetical protein QW123_04070 [Desulfurococcaceae archaeon]
MTLETKVLYTMLKHRKLLIEEISMLTNASIEVVENIIDRYRAYFKTLREEIVLVKPVELALVLISRGIEPAKVCETLNWRDFEEISLRILLESGYEAVHRLMLTSPVRLEIDVFGVEPVSGIGVAIDCKHWSANSEAKLVEAASKHIERMNKLLRYYTWLKARYRELAKAKYVLPALVTLFKPPLRVYSNVLVLGIEEMPQILRDIRVVIDAFSLELIKLPT